MNSSDAVAAWEQLTRCRWSRIAYHCGTPYEKNKLWTPDYDRFLRKLPPPPDARSLQLQPNTHVLLFGTSMLGQVLLALLCASVNTTTANLERCPQSGWRDPLRSDSGSHSRDGSLLLACDRTGYSGYRRYDLANNVSIVSSTTRCFSRLCA